MRSPTLFDCPRCGAPLPAGADNQTCPACLLSGALDGSTADTVPGTARSVAAYRPENLPADLGEYRLLRLLGKGGMGVVYEAEHRRTGRRVALKMLEHQIDTADMRRRFLREGRLAARVSHPNSLYIFGSEEIDGRPVIIMEIAAGGTLKDQLKSRGPLSPTEAVDAILGVVDGLEAACREGVLHRDVKPSNCFLSPDGPVKVGDFGLSVSTLARTDSLITAHGRILGTPAYASPEQLRGDTTDVRADIYSVGATLYTLLTDRAPFEGDNAVQVVANAVNQKPKNLGSLRSDLPPGLESVVNRCLAKEPDARYPDYKSLRDALRPFSSAVPEPAPMKVRAMAGWIDYLAAFLVPYLVLVFSVGALSFHMQPLIQRTLASGRYYFVFLALGFLYFAVTEGVWGAGPGKRLVGLRVIRTNGQRPGVVRALGRILIQFAAIEMIRLPVLFALINVPSVGALTGRDHLIFILASNICPTIAIVLLARSANRRSGFATIYDLLTGTRVVLEPRSVRRPVGELAPDQDAPLKDTECVGPYQIVSEVVKDNWMIAFDPMLRRTVWLLKRSDTAPSIERRNLSRPGRPRWLQAVETANGVWDACKAPPGAPLSESLEGGKRVEWSALRVWLHDLASEIWEANNDGTLPGRLSLGHVWITTTGHAKLLDRPWPTSPPDDRSIPVSDLAGQQRFLNALAAHVERDDLPLHARRVLGNLADGKFEKMSFLAGVVRGLLDRPAEVTPAIRAGSILMLPVYVWLLLFVGMYPGGADNSMGWPVALWECAARSTLMVLFARGLFQLIELPFRTTCSHSIFRLAVVDADGERARLGTLLVRWTVVWAPLYLGLLLGFALYPSFPEIAGTVMMSVIACWVGSALYSVWRPAGGLQDRLSGTSVVRR